MTLFLILTLSLILTNANPSRQALTLAQDQQIPRSAFYQSPQSNCGDEIDAIAKLSHPNFEAYDMIDKVVQRVRAWFSCSRKSADKIVEL